MTPDTQHPTPSRPNIIFILLDDFGWKDTSCYGSPFYETPNVDKLCKQGMKFSDAYAACPVCSPTRASIMSGKYPANVGVTDFIGGDSRAKLISAPYTQYLPLEEKSVASALRDGGYATWHIGKWHLGEDPYRPEKHGFDVNIGGGRDGQPGKGGYFSPWSISALKDVDVPEGTYLTDYLCEEAAELISNSGDQPFFMHMSFYQVHTPLQSKQEYTDYFEKKGREMGLDRVVTFEGGEVHPKSLDMRQRVRRRLVQSDPVYAGMIRSMDEGVGLIMRALEESGKADNTVVFFTSDNGGLATTEGSPTCNAPLAEGKGWMYEGGTREPLIVRWPGVIRPDSRCDVPVTSPDFYPTMLEIAGLPLIPEQHEDGVSIMPLLKEDGGLDREAIFWHYPHYGNQGGTPGSSVRAGDWKLIEFFEDGRLELYNLRCDIGEDVDIADKHPDVVERLHTLLKDWRDSVEAKYPEPNPDWPW